MVGIGASAGGYEALAQFFPVLPPDTGMAFVVVQHLDPKHESLLPELLAKLTKMPVSQVKDRTQVKANQVYVIPPNTLMTITDKMLCLTARPKERKPQMSIDHFLRSLAESHDGQAIGIILSGSSSDGALGIEAIKHAGGITFAQEEKSARYPFMPRSAIATGCVDFVLPPEGIARELAEVARHPYLSRYHPAKAKGLPVKDKNLGRILGLLNKASGVDLTHYKHSTIWRRIMRRMALNKITKPEAYIRYLQENPGEVTNLYQDVLIKVTGFFRDPEAFEALKTEIFPLIQRQKSPEVPVRIWVPGCSTGEEAYSLAMSLAGVPGRPGRGHPHPGFRHGRERYGDREGPEWSLPGKYCRGCISGEIGPFFCQNQRLLSGEQNRPGHVHFRPTEPDPGPALLQVGPHQLPQRPHLFRAGAAKTGSPNIPFRPQAYGLSDGGGLRDHRPVPGVLLSGEPEIQNLPPESPLWSNAPGPGPERPGRRNGSDRQASRCGRGLEQERSLQGSGLPDAQQVCSPGGVGQRGDGNSAIPGGDGLLSRAGPGGGQLQPHEDGPERLAHGAPQRHQRGQEA